MTWRTRFAIRILFAIAEMICDNTEIGNKIRSIGYDFKSDYPKPGDGEVISATSETQ